MLREHSSGYPSNLKKKILKKFGEHRWFLIGRTFASRTYFGVFVELRRSYVRSPKGFAQHVCEYSPSSAHFASDWLKAENSPVDEEEIKTKTDDGVARYFTRLGDIFSYYLLTCGRQSLVSGIQNDIVVS